MQHCECTKTHWTTRVTRWVVWYVNYISIKLFLNKKGRWMKEKIRKREKENQKKMRKGISTSCPRRTWGLVHWGDGSPTSVLSPGAPQLHAATYPFFFMGCSAHTCLLGSPTLVPSGLCSPCLHFSVVFRVNLAVTSLSLLCEPKDRVPLGPVTWHRGSWFPVRLPDDPMRLPGRRVPSSWHRPGRQQGGWMWVEWSCRYPHKQLP